MTVPPKGVLGIAAAALSVGCYTYTPVTLDAVPVGSEVRALLSTEREVARLLDRPEVIEALGHATVSETQNELG